MGNGKASNLIEYLDKLQEKGKASQGAITPLKIAFSKVLQVVDGVEWENIDVKSIDVDDYMARFANLTMGKYSTDSLSAYKSRINRAITWYLTFLERPGWAPNLQQRTRASKVDKKSAPTSLIAQKQPQATTTVTAPQSMPEVANAPGRVLYPYPLLDGQLIHISLPIKLTKLDARRIGAFVESIAVDEPKKDENDG